MNLTEVAHIVLSKLTEYLDESESAKGKVLTQLPANEIVDLLHIEKWVKEGGFAENGVQEFMEDYFTQHSANASSSLYRTSSCSTS